MSDRFGRLLTLRKPQAVDDGDIDIAHVRNAARRILKHRMTLGFFDTISSQPLLRLNDSARSAAKPRPGLHGAIGSFLVTLSRY